MSMSAALVMIAQLAGSAIGADQAPIAPRSMAVGAQASASVRILRPVVLRMEDGEITPPKGHIPPQRSDGTDGQVWFEFS